MNRAKEKERGSLDRERTKRKVKNALVRTDDVEVGPGHHYADWAVPARHKLKVREIKLLSRRINAFCSTVTASFAVFAEENTEYFFHFRQNRNIRVSNMDKANRRMFAALCSPQHMVQLLDRSTLSIEHALTGWGGVKLSKKMMTKQLSFRDYFLRSKNWFDQTKVAIMVREFWSPLICAIDRLSKLAAAQFFAERFHSLQRQYSEYLKLLVLWNVFNAKMSVPNTRDVLVIPSACFAKLTEHQQLSFLKSPSGNGEPLRNATKIRTETVQRVAGFLRFRRQQFHESLYTLHFAVENYFCGEGSNSNSKPHRERSEAAPPNSSAEQKDQQNISLGHQQMVP